MLNAMVPWVDTFQVTPGIFWDLQDPNNERAALHPDENFLVIHASWSLTHFTLPILKKYRSWAVLINRTTWVRSMWFYIFCPLKCSTPRFASCLFLRNIFLWTQSHNQLGATLSARICVATALKLFTHFNVKSSNSLSRNLLCNVVLLIMLCADFVRLVH